MSHPQDEGPQPHDPQLKPEDLTADSGSGDFAAPQSSGSGLHRDRNTAEISGEMIDVVGEATGEFPTAAADNRSAESTGRSAFMVGAGILISRIIGVIR